MPGEADRHSPLESPHAYPGAPRWVKLGGLGALVLVVLAALVMVLVGGNHGPMRHLPPGSSGPTTTLAMAIAV
jgi:hypothetical protein